MPTFEIEQYEIHVLTYRVEAPTEAQAIAKLFQGKAEPVDGSLEFVEISEDLGCLPTTTGNSPMNSVVWASVSGK